MENLRKCPMGTVAVVAECEVARHAEHSKALGIAAPLQGGVKVGACPRTIRVALDVVNRKKFQLCLGTAKAAAPIGRNDFGSKVVTPLLPGLLSSWQLLARTTLLSAGSAEFEIANHGPHAVTYGTDAWGFWGRAVAGLVVPHVLAALRALLEAPVVSHAKALRAGRRALLTLLSVVVRQGVSRGFLAAYRRVFVGHHIPLAPLL